MPKYPHPRNLQIAPTAWVGDHSVLGAPSEETLRKLRPSDEHFDNAPVVIGERAIIGCHVVLTEGVSIGEGCVIEDFASVGPRSIVGAGTRLCYSAIVGDEVSIGAECVIGGFVCDGAHVGDRSRIFGALVHEQSQPHRGWWEVNEVAPRILAYCTIGWGATVVGGVTVGPCVYVIAGARVTKSVPPKTIVSGSGCFIPAAEWRGERLKDLIQWWGGLSCET